MRAYSTQAQAPAKQSLLPKLYMLKWLSCYPQQTFVCKLHVRMSIKGITESESSLLATSYLLFNGEQPPSLLVILGCPNALLSYLNLLLSLFHIADYHCMWTTL